MPDTFPGLQEDAAGLIRKANELILQARALRVHAEAGDAARVRETCETIGEMGAELAEVCETFATTSNHFVTYDDEDAAA